MCKKLYSRKDISKAFLLIGKGFFGINNSGMGWKCPAGKRYGRDEESVKKLI